MTKDQRRLFEDVAEFLSVNARPVANSDLIWRSRRFRDEFYSFCNGAFPFIVRCVIHEYPSARMRIVEVFDFDDESLHGDPVRLLSS